MMNSLYEAICERISLNGSATRMLINEMEENISEVARKVETKSAQLNDEINEVSSHLTSLTEQITDIKTFLFALIIIGFITMAIGIAILYNQRKIKKQLQELLDQKEDKPE